jgi:fructoselysine-6-P-deglycase FrlB-like protein
MTLTADEIASQPDIWHLALREEQNARELLAAPGERVLVIGCGTSAFIAQSIASLRETAGLGVTDARYASEPWEWRDWDRVIAISRSGTTTEVIDALRRVPAGTRRVAVTGVADSPVAALTDDILDLGFADEQSVVQTRFPTTLLVLARAAFGEDVTGLIEQARAVISGPPAADPRSVTHFVYLGTGWSVGLAEEAALKVREAAQAWAEAYPFLDYRHGPLAVAGPGSLVWFLDAPDDAQADSLADEVRATGAAVRIGRSDPLAELVLAQRLAIDLAAARGLNPDAPRHLARSIILD